VVPVESAVALERIAVDPGAMRAALGTDWTGVYVVAALPDGSWAARMFTPLTGIAEDPATGSAAVAFAAVLLEAGVLGEGRQEIAIRQGAEMGRPSALRIAPTVSGGALVSVELSGEAVLVAEGTLHI
jgi:trans-2,3-dihydro-3-hydroxyanthranilate isomerase